MKFSRVLGLVLIGMVLSGVAVARAEPMIDTAPPTISNVRVMTPNSVVFERFEIQFDVTTVATNLYMPYDAQPPKGVPPSIGVTVDALFSNDGWKTTVTQPAFLYQGYDVSFRNQEDHLVPNSIPRWAARFAPQLGGTWQFRIRVVDHNGIALSPTNSFVVFEGGGDRYSGLRESPYTRKGLIRVSQTDPRYFEFDNGDPFYAQGYNTGFNTLPGVERFTSLWQANGINLVRIWLSGSSINSSAWSSWTFPAQGTGATALTTDVTAPGSHVSLYINNDRRCVYTDFFQEDVPVTPSTKYHVWARVKLQNVDQWDKVHGGFAMRAGGFSGSCTTVKGIDVDAPVLHGTTDWTIVEGDLTTNANQYWLPYLWLILDKAQGEIWIDEVRMYRADDPAKINLLREPRADSVYEYDPMNSFKWDEYIIKAENKGIYLKLVTDEKDEWIRNHLDFDGGIAAKPGNSRFYAAPNTQVRWLDEAWWRYLIARWGYSTAIHSFEFVNEGDPFSTFHYEAANAMAKYFHEHDPARHMVTTSLWHSYPGAQFWANPEYSDIDYADLHAYILTGWGDNASFVPDANLETRPQYVRSAPTSLHIPIGKGFEQELTPRGVDLKEQGEWVVRYRMKGVNVRAKCASGSSVGILWKLDGGVEEGGRESGVPGAANEGKPLCSAPSGTFDWTAFASDKTADGKEQFAEQRIVIDDNQPHESRLFARDLDGISGDVWIDDLEVVTPSGKVLPIIGSFDPDSFTSDTAWYTAAYSELWGANSPVAARMPLIRAEGGINSKSKPNGLLDLNKDQEGVWLHNFIWGQINAGGMYELLWWATEMVQDNPKTGRSGDLYWQYKTFQEFMWDIPINNGNYRDAEAKTSDPNLRAWGQRDDVNGKAHLWIQNRAHMWDRVVAKQPMPPIEGTITLANMRAGTYQIEWWDTNRTSAPIFKTETASVQDTLTLELPQPLVSDIAVKIQRIAE